jgi:hypothetical protein
VERFKATAAKGPIETQRVAPLIAAAQEFAECLNPPPPLAPAAPVSPPIQLAASKPSEPKPVTRPAFSPISFKLVATSYYEGRPDRSMALLSEMGGTDGGRWVREGTQVGHFTVHEIRHGTVVLRDGDNVRELAVERAAIQQGLVKEVRPAASQAKALVVDHNE